MLIFFKCKFYLCFFIFFYKIILKFDIAEDYALVRNFEKETNISLDAEKQIQKEDRKKEWELER